MAPPVSPAFAADETVPTSPLSRVRPGRRLRVLLLAEIANPHWISVPMVGWRHIEAVAQFADVHVITHVRNRDDILASGWPARDVTFIGPTSIERYVNKLENAISSTGAMNGITQTAFSVPRYYQFEHEAWTRFAPQIEAGEFDIIHRVTPVSPGVPSLFAARAAEVSVPFVLGPVNGGVPWPKGFEDERRREGEWIGHLRGAYRLLPYYRSVRQNASAILVGSAKAWRDMPTSVQDKLFYLPENAIDACQFSRTTTAYGDTRLRIAFVGRLVACKGVEMLLHAAAPLIHEGSVELDIIGDGPEVPRLAEIVRAEALQKGVRMNGWVQHGALQERLLESSVLGFPSIREFGGAAVMEAMMLGLIPIVVGYGGPVEIVDESCGFVVPLGSREKVQQGLRDVLVKLVAMSPAEREQLGTAARSRITNDFSIPTKRDKTQAVYEWLVGRAEKPTHLTPPADALALYKQPLRGLF